jgi:DNA-binding LytR/AlgR family response regulator
MIKILYIEALADYITIHTEDGKYTVLSTMKNVESMLSQDFFRVHNSFIVNLNHITAIENSFLYINNVQIPVSRNKAKSLMSRFKIIK